MNQKPSNAYAMYENQIDYVYQKEHAQKGPFILKCQDKFSSMSLKKVDCWTQKQKIRYAIFLRYFTNQLDWLKGKNLCPYFDAMAVFITTRNSNQCRIHHNKMMKYYSDKQGLILLYGGKYKNFAAMCQQHQENLRKLGKSVETEPLNLRKIAQSNKNGKLCRQEKMKSITEEIVQNEQSSGHQFYQKQPKDDNVGTASSYIESSPPFKTFDSKTPYGQAARSTLPSFSAPSCPPAATLPSFSQPQISAGPFPPSVSGQGMIQFCYAPIYYEAMMSQQSLMAAAARQEEWADCHNHFILWMDKLTKLVEGQEPPFKSQSLRGFETPISCQFSNFNPTSFGSIPNFSQH